MQETNGTTRLKIPYYDSLSGEHVWVNSEIYLTSVKSGVMSLASHQN